MATIQVSDAASPQRTPISWIPQDCVSSGWFLGSRRPHGPKIPKRSGARSVNRRDVPDIREVSVQHDEAASSWRHHASGRHPYGMVALSGRVPRRQLQPEAPRAFHPDAGTGAVRCLLHGGPPGRAEHARPGVTAQRDGDLVRAYDAAFGSRDGDGTDWSGRDGIDDVRRALPCRPPVRVARPHQQWPRGMECRHDRQPRRGAQFRADRPCRARRTLPAGA